jgi:hypothetical protein
MTVTNIVFGDPVTPTATATTGNLEDQLITIAIANVTVSPTRGPFVSGRMKVQWEAGGRPQKQVSRRVEVNDHLVAVHLDEK